MTDGRSFTPGLPGNVPRLFLDISKSAAQLIQYSRSSQIPLTDECPSIHVFCAKLEYLLLFGLKPVGGIFNKKPAVEYFSFLRQVTKQSKQLIDGLRYINLKKSLQTDLGRGRGLLRYYLSQNCLADLLQTIITDKKSIDDFFTTGALIRHPGLVQVVECIYALYNIQFAFIPVNQNCDLDINWPNTAAKLLVYGPSSSSPPIDSVVTPPINSSDEKVKKWLSSGIGTESEKSTANGRSFRHNESHDEDETLNDDQRTQEYEEKQEVMARVISELENRNADLEEQLNISKSENRIKKHKRTRRVAELNDSNVGSLNLSRSFRRNLRSCSTPYSNRSLVFPEPAHQPKSFADELLELEALEENVHPTIAVPLSPNNKRGEILFRSAIGLEFETMSNLSEGSDKNSSSRVPSSKTSPDKVSLHSGIEPLSSTTQHSFGDPIISDTVNKSLVDSYKSQLERSEEQKIEMKIEFEAKIRVAILDLGIRIISEEKCRTEEECCRLRDENDVYRNRVKELSEFHTQHSPSTGEALIREVELLAGRVETLKGELTTEKSKNAELELSISYLASEKTTIATQTIEKGVNIDEMEKSLQKYNTETSELSERIATIDDEYGRKLREKDLEKEQLEARISELEEKVTCLDLDLNMKTRQCKEVQEDLAKHLAESQNRPSIDELENYLYLRNIQEKDEF
ncbi:Oidioi.mRNA.OKI2018_I69.XSR.g15508.t3.cds [Oikopleura dioica]|uniref:Oidioi.mRNA.OKI2018_I69.XSR.g15508.t3.cds n=1 Tax=Oikopleura dioica TaxID=34765 RepID=A0ABN7SKH6_OIKDI|nr:Oidioi.mRNA.OKI2018_I69.XSR.g15508.t3.cds [Oikopleura dioica]